MAPHIRTLHVTFTGDNNETYQGVVTLENMTRSDEDSKEDEYDQHGAAIFVCAVIVIYGLSIVLLLCSYSFFKNEDWGWFMDFEEKQVDQFLRAVPNLKEEGQRDRKKKLKQALLAVGVSSRSRNNSTGSMPERCNNKPSFLRRLSMSAGLSSGHHRDDRIRRGHRADGEKRRLQQQQGSSSFSDISQDGSATNLLQVELVPNPDRNTGSVDSSQMHTRLMSDRGPLERRITESLKRDYRDVTLGVHLQPPQMPSISEIDELPVRPLASHGVPTITITPDKEESVWKTTSFPEYDDADRNEVFHPIKPADWLSVPEAIEEEELPPPPPPIAQESSVSTQSSFDIERKEHTAVELSANMLMSGRFSPPGSRMLMLPGLCASPSISPPSPSSRRSSRRSSRHSSRRSSRSDPSSSAGGASSVSTKLQKAAALLSVQLNLTQQEVVTNDEELTLITTSI